MQYASMYVKMQAYAQKISRGMRMYKDFCKKETAGLEQEGGLFYLVYLSVLIKI